MSILVEFRIPTYRKHRATGQAIVTLSGKDHYLGIWNTAASKEFYNRLIQEWLAHGRQLPKSDAGLTVNELILAFWRHAQQHYRKADGTPTSELNLVKVASRPLKELYGRTEASAFGPLALKAVRQWMVDADLCRKVVNCHVHRIKRIFKWGVENELVPPSIYHGLQAVSGLRRGRSTARESKPVKPANEAIVQAVVPHVSKQVQAMIRLQLLTAMRPGEVCMLRGCDLDMTGRIWKYRPATHKTEHHDQEREIYIGPQAQAILRPWLRLETQAHLFSPQEAEAARNELKRTNRKSPMTPSQAGRKPKKSRRRPWRDHYDVNTYRRAIQRGCEVAFPLPSHLAKSAKESTSQWKGRLTPEEREEIQTWRREHSWHPHQLRHNAATRLRKEFGVELARIILGHATAFTTEIYAEADRTQAMEVIAKVG